MAESLLTNTLKMHRAMADLTQEELAQAAGVTRQTIFAIEKGNYTPSVLLALRLARILKHSVEEIFHENIE